MKTLKLVTFLTALATSITVSAQWKVHKTFPMPSGEKMPSALVKSADGSLVLVVSHQLPNKERKGAVVGSLMLFSDYSRKNGQFYINKGKDGSETSDISFVTRGYKANQNHLYKYWSTPLTPDQMIMGFPVKGMDFIDAFVCGKDTTLIYQDKNNQVKEVRFTLKGSTNAFKQAFDYSANCKNAFKA